MVMLTVLFLGTLLDHIFISDEFKLKLYNKMVMNFNISGTKSIFGSEN